MKVRHIALAAAIAGFTLTASAVDFGLPKMGGNKGNAEADISSFLQTADEAHKLTSQSAFHLSQALLEREAAQEILDKVAAAKGIAEPKEREAAMAQVEQDMNAKLAKVDYEAKGNELSAAKDKKKASLVSASMYNFVLGLLKDKELTSKGGALVSSAGSNPMLLTKVGEVKNVMSSLSGQMSNMGQIATGLQKLSTKIKSVPLPTSATAAPVAAAD
jgi:hypothetical protein